MFYYLLIAAIFGGIATFKQFKLFGAGCVLRDLGFLVTFFVNGLLWPLVLGLNIFKVIKGNRTVQIFNK